jgi:hypothetical protein
MNKMKKNIIKLTIVSVVTFIVAGFSYEYLYKPDRSIIAHASYAYDITNEEVVVENAQHVIIGTVTKKMDERYDGLGVYTPYLVVVDTNLKGELSLNKEIEISQRMGYDNKLKATVKFRENDTYLQTGNSYVLMLTYDEHEDIYRITVPEFGNIKVKVKGSNSINEKIVNEYKEVIKRVSKQPK